MLLLWRPDSAWWHVGLGYALVGTGVGLAGTPASHPLTGSVPVRRAGMASGTADLQRDLGDAIMQSVLGALLTAGYSSALLAQLSASPQAQEVSTATRTALSRSYASAANVAEQYPQYRDQIVAAARTSFLDGANWAYALACVLVVVAGVIVALALPGRDREQRILEGYQAEDASTAV